MKNTYILGISAFYHDAAAALKYVYYTKSISNGGHVICVSPIDDDKTEIQITKPVLLGNSGKYSEEFSPDWHQE